MTNKSTSPKKQPVARKGGPKKDGMPPAPPGYAVTARFIPVVTNCGCERAANAIPDIAAKPNARATQNNPCFVMIAMEKYRNK
jgi:hypothetical protein